VGPVCSIIDRLDRKDIPIRLRDFAFKPGLEHKPDKLKFACRCALVAHFSKSATEENE
jgi:hypothetical protein